MKRDLRKDAELKRLYKKLEYLFQQECKVKAQINALETKNEYDISKEMQIAQSESE